MTKAKTDSKVKMTLDAQKREVFGKKLKSLRAEGLVPGNVYGKDIASTAISINARDFVKAFRLVGETQVLYLNLDKKELPVVVSNVQVHPVNEMVIHADFKKVDLTQKSEAHVPILIVGESEAIAQRKGDLATITDEILVEALPSDMPQEIEIDISTLKEIDDQISVADLKPAGNYVFLSEPETVIVKINEHKEESIEPDTSSEGEAPAAEGDDAAAAAEGGDADGDASADEAVK